MNIRKDINATYISIYTRKFAVFIQDTYQFANICLTTITEHQIRKNVFAKISKIRKKTVHRNYYNYRGLQCPFKVRNNIKVESSQMYEYKKYYCAK